MTRKRFLAELLSHRAYCESRSPLYADILRSLLEDAETSPLWLSRIESGWKGRSFPMGWESCHLLLACLHLWALRGAAPELAATFPSCGGSGRNAGAAARAFLRRAPAAFWRELGSFRMQTNEVGRSIAWVLPGSAVFGSRGLPFHLVELGASAGLNLIGDLLRRRCTSILDKSAETTAGPCRVLSRTGLDIEPRRLSDPRDLLWIKACVWPDDHRRLQRLERAVEVYLEAEKSPCGPRLECCDFAGSPDWLRWKIRPRSGEGLLVFNAAATAFLDDKHYGILKRDMMQALQPWRDRALWVECEWPRGRSRLHELRAHRFVEGRLETRTLALMTASAKDIRLLDGWRAFAVGA